MQENETEALSFDKKTLLLSVNKNYVHIHENEDTPGREKSWRMNICMRNVFRFLFL